MSFKDQLSQLVYSTDTGKITPEQDTEQVPSGDGIVRIRRETKGRKGKGVTVIQGLEVNTDTLKSISKALKKKCGVGGSVKDFTIEIQGDQREVCKAHLENEGYKVKLAGG